MRGRYTSSIWRWMPDAREEGHGPPSQQAIDDRDRRQAFGETRSLTGQLLGDPPAGRSALEQKIEAEIRRQMTQPITSEEDEDAPGE